jgi:hypothetical protein
MNQNKQKAITFLKELDSEVEQFFNDSETIIFLAERLYKMLNEWIEQNPDISRSEGFKGLEKDIRALYQTCNFLVKDCLDIRHSISDCGVELN